MDDTFSELTSQLQQWNGRRQLRDGLLWLPRGVLIGLLLAALVATAARLRPLLTNQEVGYAALALGGGGLIISLIVLLLQRRTVLQQARFADRQFRLQERASTAVEIQNGRLPVAPELARQQLDDALNSTRRVDTKTGLPLQFNRRDWLVLAVAIALLITAVFLPNSQADALKKQRNIDQTIDEQISELEALEEEIQQNPELNDEQKEELLDPVEGALEQLNEGNVSQEGAVATLSEAEAELRELSSEYSQEDLINRLETAGEPLANNSNSQSLGEALQNGDLSQAGAAAAQLADQLPEMSAAELAQLAEDLAETAAALEGVDSELAAELATAAEALQNGDVAAAQQALQEAAGTLQQRAQQSAAAQQAQSAAGQLGEGRQEVAQAGEATESGQGQPTDGQGQGQGQGEGEGSGQGQGQGQGEGEGSGQGQGQGSGSEQGEGTGGPGPGGGHTENVFVPDFVDLSGEAGVDIELPAECIANPADCGGLLNENPTEFTEQGSSVPYTQVYGDYRNAASEALQDDYIPLGMKGFVRDYFSSLEP